MKTLLRIYLAHPITGLSYPDVAQYYKDTSKELQKIGYSVFHPMVAKGVLRNEKRFKSVGYDTPCSTNHAIVERDLWMVSQADIVYCNFANAKETSIGMTAELAVAHYLKKHTVITLPDDNVHQHAFILDMADIIFKEHTESIEYLAMLINGDIEI